MQAKYSFNKRTKKTGMLFFLVFFKITAFSQINDSITAKNSPKKLISPKEKAWYDNFSIRGYTQLRYNRLLETNKNLKCEQCDRSWGENGGFFMRRMRIIIFGQISERVYIYFQPDLASSPSSDRLHFAQIRDAYIDVGLDKNNEFRFRVGQSKVPFGFENMQSSQNRLPLDRNDALNSAVSNERDIGLFFYWAPKKVRKLYSMFVREGLKGSGDYGVFGIGAYNGQTANNPELNENLHKVVRLNYPIKIGNQYLEPGIQAYSGKFVVTSKSTNTKIVKDRNYLDERVAGSLILYPKPFGIQAEYNVGKGPEFNKHLDSITTQRLKGGYVTLTYKYQFRNQLFYPFTRIQYYSGGKKHELDARSYEVKELELGIEWQPFKTFEIVLMYTISERRFEDFALQDNLQKGRLLRIQVQANF